MTVALKDMGSEMFDIYSSYYNVFSSEVMKHIHQYILSHKDEILLG